MMLIECAVFAKCLIFYLWFSFQSVCVCARSWTFRRSQNPWRWCQLLNMLVLRGSCSLLVYMVQELIVSFHHFFTHVYICICVYTSLNLCMFYKMTVETNIVHSRIVIEGYNQFWLCLDCMISWIALAFLNLAFSQRGP